MAHPKEFESPTFRLGGGRSILLSYGCVYENEKEQREKSSTVGFLRRRTLYPAELQARIYGV